MAIPTYNWSEPAIVRLAEQNHVPTEEMAPISIEGGVNTQISCDSCGNPWPCAVLLDLRAWWEENDRKRLAMREERGKR